MKAGRENEEWTNESEERRYHTGDEVAERWLHSLDSDNGPASYPQR